MSLKAGDDEVDAYLREVTLLADKITELKKKAGTVPSYQEAKDKSEVCSSIYSLDMSENEWGRYINAHLQIDSISVIIIL